MNRYATTPIINVGMSKGTSSAVHNIRIGVSSGSVRFSERTLQESQRLDVLAGIEYGDSKLWWVIAAASNVGWGMQVPAGTLIRIPALSDVERVM